MVMFDPHSINQFSACPRPRLWAKTGQVRTRKPCEQGFTLLEVLTAMALFFMVAGILASGVVQAIRVAEVGAVESTNARDQSMRLQWFRETVGLTVLPSMDPKILDRPPPMLGTDRVFNGVSMRAQNTAVLAPAQYRFELKFDAASGQTQLVMADLARAFGADPAGRQMVLASWPGSRGNFRYLDDNNNWQDSWPERAQTGKTTDFSRSQLPKAVALEYGMSGSPAKNVVVAIQDRALPLPSMRELMQ